MAKLFCVFVACISVVMLTSCSARIEYNWSTGLSLSEFTESSPELIEKITSDNTIASGKSRDKLFCSSEDDQEHDKSD